MAQMGGNFKVASLRPDPWLSTHDGLLVVQRRWLPRGLGAVAPPRASPLRALPCCIPSASHRVQPKGRPCCAQTGGSCKGWDLRPCSRTSSQAPCLGHTNVSLVEQPCIWLELHEKEGGNCPWGSADLSHCQTAPWAPACGMTTTTRHQEAQGGMSGAGSPISSPSGHKAGTPVPSFTLCKGGRHSVTPLTCVFHRVAPPKQLTLFPLVPIPFGAAACDHRGRTFVQEPSQPYLPQFL